MKRLLSVFLTVVMLVLPMAEMTVWAKPSVAGDGATSEENDFEALELSGIVTRDDGTWLFPVDKQYYQKFSDWCCCPGTDKCVLCNTYHTSWGDSAHSGQKGHNGIDLATPSGTPVYASAPGKFYKGGSNSDSRGFYIVIEHPIANNLSYYSGYQHLSSFNTSLSNGQSVNAGDLIGYTGGSGAGSGVHLHFGIVIGSSGKGLSGLNTYELWGSSNPWATKPEQTQGRIINNPADNFPTSTAGATLAAIKAHAGSVHYTFDKTKVDIGYVGDSSGSSNLKYDPQKAVEYAKNHWNDGKGLCAEFASDCLAAGGCTAWNIGCTSLVSQLKKENWGVEYQLTLDSNGYIKDSLNSGKIAAGDLIFHYCTSCRDYGDGKPYIHVYVCSEVDSSGYWLGYAHNNAHSGRIYGKGYCYADTCDRSTNIAYVFHMTAVASDSEKDDNSNDNYATITEATYTINSTVNSYRYLTAKDDSNGGGVTGKPADNTSSQTFKIVQHNGSYRIIACGSSSGRVVNVYTYPLPTSQNGYNVTLWSVEADGNNASQLWYFQETSDNTYSIHPTDNPNVALTANDNGSISVNTYEKATNQHWILTNLDEYTITFNANGGTVFPTTKTVISGEKYGELPTPTKAGYAFNGWYTATSGGTKITSDTTVNLSADQTLYAQWTANTYTVTYNANGGSGAPANQTKTHGVNLTLSTTKPTKTGYTFKGWATSAGGSVAYASGATYSANANVTLYAVWQTNTVSVTSITLNKTSASLKVGENVTLTATVAPSNATNKAVTWTTSNASVATVANGVVTAVAAGSATITAKTADGGKTASCVVTVALPEEPVNPDAATIAVDDVTTRAGETFEVKVYVTNNPGMCFLQVTLEYDKSVLTLKGASNGSVLSTFENGVNMQWSADADTSENGTLVTLTFDVNEAAEAGEYTVNTIFREAYDQDLNDVVFAVSAGTITVTDFVYGDANGDGEVNGKDAVLLRKYMVNYNYDTGVSSVTVSPGADANGDGEINGKDAVLLRKYMVNYNYDTGSSSVVLGPRQ